MYRGMTESKRTEPILPPPRATALPPTGVSEAFIRDAVADALAADKALTDLAVAVEHGHMSAYAALVQAFGLGAEYGGTA